MRFERAVPVLCGLLSVAAGAVAQEKPMGPPPVLAMSREEIKPGKMGAHDKQVAAYLALFQKAKAGGSRLGLVPVSGDDNQVLYLEGYPSFAQFEASRKRFDEAMAVAPYQAELEALDRQAGDLHASQKTSIAVLRDDMSYRPMNMDAVARARYFNASWTRVKPGRGPAYVEFVKQFNAARAKANLDEHSAVYQVVTGAQTGTFVSFTTQRSLTEWDDMVGRREARTKAIDEALGGDPVVKQRADTAEGIIADGWTTLYAVSPKLSQPTPLFAAADPDFWGPKQAGKATAVKKEPIKK